MSYIPLRNEKQNSSLLGKIIKDLKQYIEQVSFISIANPSKQESGVGRKHTLLIIRILYRAIVENCETQVDLFQKASCKYFWPISFWFNDIALYKVSFIIWCDSMKILRISITFQWNVQLKLTLIIILWLFH